MKKMLVMPDVWKTALDEPDSEAERLIDKCRTDPMIQGWVLSSTPLGLIEKGYPVQPIKRLLSGFAQIPVNALLNRKAMASSADYHVALHQAAADVFKIPILVAESPEPVEGIYSSAEALAMKGDAAGKTVDLMNLNLGLHPVFNQVDGWFMEIIQDTAFAGGAHVAAFETEFAAFCQAQFTVGVGSGTEALLFALLALGVACGDEVITVPNTFIATTEAISQAGARPVFVDVRPDTYTLDPFLIESKITDRTRAIIPVHLYGQVADMDPIMAVAEKHGLNVVEDACQAHGALYKGRRAGTLGHAAAFSMYPGKNLGAFGEAGCVVTNDQRVADEIRCLRDHGQVRKYYHRREGFNGRMDNLQAAALRAKLPYVDANNKRRREIAAIYQRRLLDLSSLILPDVLEDTEHIFHQFVVLVPDPQDLSAFLKKKGIQTAFHYPIPLHLQEAYRQRGEEIDCYPVTESCAQRLISLPMFPELSDPEVMAVCEAIRAYFQNE